MIKSWTEITDSNLWDKSLNEKEQASFLQAWAFGDFHQKLGSKVWRLGQVEGDKLTGFCLTVKLKSKIGSFLYVPGGPFIDNWEESLPSLVTSLNQLGKTEKVSFVRLDPRGIGEHQLQMLVNSGLKEAPSYTQPQCTLILDLEKDIEELKKGLGESTRYNIGWVERQGVRVEVSEKPTDIGLFNGLLRETALRHKFRLVDNLDYYQEQYLSFLKRGQSKLYLSYAPEDMSPSVLAAAIVIYFGKTATYLHASSSSLAPKLRAPYLMQWKIITDAKKEGFKIYDFWGVAKDDNPRDPLAGVTTFKKSFGGHRLGYEKPYDLVLEKRGYYTSLLGELTRNLIKKYRSYV